MNGNSVQYSGFLEKKGKVNTAWKHRWCVISDDKMYYYKSRDQKKDKPTGVIDLTQSTIKVRIFHF